MAIKISFVSLVVDDQQKAKAFYTEKLGFITKMEMDMGGAWWLTLVSPDAPDGVQLSLEPNNNPTLNGAAQEYQRTLVAHGIAATAFQVDDVQTEYERLTALGVIFTEPPAAAGPTIQAVLDDTCGNLIQLFQI